MIATPAKPRQVEVLYDQPDGRVVSIIEGFVGDRTTRAGLPCLFVNAGLGSAQRIREIARSSKGLPEVLSSHAAAMQALLPILHGPRRDSLLHACHGR